MSRKSSPLKWFQIVAGVALAVVASVVRTMGGEASYKQTEADGATLWVYPIQEGTSGLVLAMKDG